MLPSANGPKATHAYAAFGKAVGRISQAGRIDTLTRISDEDLKRFR
ncbi:MAG: hypothetical protein LBJ62_05275 [Bifidobacteriaceae bacterium]|jgi:hypothetical protein|nr:hypothetical protein [Bifidobacteriaceae bacterium]